ncbi:hypothetical protein C8R47DRAFT_1212691 [Mycena vitilis]|nr:hypothetical protein C8R47DRAFT_1212691 [Mycena vitilis]
MTSFDPPVVLALLVAAQPKSDRAKFEKEWITKVNTRLKKWLEHRDTQSKYEPQLRWEANVVEYVMFLKNETKPKKTGKNSTSGPQQLKPGIPIYGPKFFPPSLTDTRLRADKIKPDTAYLRPTNIIHPVYYPTLAKCPECGSTDVSWDGWNATGSREVHGLKREETALGYQLRHEACSGASIGTVIKNRCFATTNQAFWKKWQHWEVPRGIPHFFSRCAVTRELFDLIIEFRLSSTSGGLAEHIKQLHLLEYHEYSLEYLQVYQKTYAAPGSLPFLSTSVTAFSLPNEAGYNDTSITDDLIRDVYMAFIERTRADESDEYLRVCLSADNTFKVAGKATVVDASKVRTKVMKGGILSMLNELNEIRFCQSASPVEMYEVLTGLKKRCEELGVPFPQMFVADNCCQIEKEVRRAIPDIQICLDVFHFMIRYLAAIINGVNNPHRGEVAAAIRNALLKNSASKGVLAKYWTKEEQESKMREMYDRFSRRGSVWSAAAHAVHTAQLKHLQKGCLSRSNQDIASDGSRIESSHKGWNGLQRASASGLELQNALCHDFVHRRNMRIAFSKKPDAPGSHAFVRSTFGSHHTRLVNRTALLLNSILEFEAAKKSRVPDTLALRPLLRNVASGETFGLVVSQHNDSFGGLLTIKSEAEAEDKLFPEVMETPTDPQPEAVLADLNIEAALLYQPQKPENGAIPLDVQIIDMPASFSQYKQLDNAVAPPRVIESDVSATVLGQLFDQDATILSATTSSSKRKELDPAIHKSDPQTIEPVAVPPAKKARLNDSIRATASGPSKISGPVYPMFNLAAAHATPTVQTPSSDSSPHPTTPQSVTDLAQLTKLLPLPPHADEEISKLTRSQRLFLFGTGTNPKSLEIAKGPEFYLFMEMRAESGWKASDMTSKKWADAVGRYNERLAVKIPDAVTKSPPQNGDEKFWRTHCYAVALLKAEPVASGVSDKAENTSSRKIAVCTRCSKVMYPGPTGSQENHKKGYCSDGFKQKPPAGEVAPWPQPAGIFTTGSEFHPLPFLEAIRDVYEKVVVEADSTSLTIEHEALALMLKDPARTLEAGGAILFKLFTGYAIPADDRTPDALFVDHGGLKYLRLDALSSGGMS